MSDTTENTQGATPLPGVEAKAKNPDLRWYVVHAYSGMEKAVERNIKERINRAGMQDKFGRILVPTEEVVEIKLPSSSGDPTFVAPAEVELP